MRVRSGLSLPGPGDPPSSPSSGSRLPGSTLQLAYSSVASSAAPDPSADGTLPPRGFSKTALSRAVSHVEGFRQRHRCPRQPARHPSRLEIRPGSRRRPHLSVFLEVWRRHRVLRRTGSWFHWFSQPSFCFQFIDFCSSVCCFSPPTGSGFVLRFFFWAEGGGFQVVLETFPLASGLRFPMRYPVSPR